MKTTDVLLDGLNRISPAVHAAVDELDEADLTRRVDPEANSIASLVWHLTRVQDDHVSGLAGTEQVWTGAGWYDKFKLPIDQSATGYGDDADQVNAISNVSADLLLAYFDAVHEMSTAYVSSAAESDLDAVVDTNWEPPVTCGARLVSVIADDLQHVGQAAYVRGLLARARPATS